MQPHTRSRSPWPSSKSVDAMLVVDIQDVVTLRSCFAEFRRVLKDGGIAPCCAASSVSDPQGIEPPEPASPSGDSSQGRDPSRSGIRLSSQSDTRLAVAAAVGSFVFAALPTGIQG